MFYGLDIFIFQISIHTLKLDVAEKYFSWRIYQTMAFEKVLDNGLLLMVRIFVDPKYVRQIPLRNYQTMAFCYMVQIFLDSQYLFIHSNWMCRKSTPFRGNFRQWPLRKHQTMALFI